MFVTFAPFCFIKAYSLVINVLPSDVYDDFNRKYKTEIEAITSDTFSKLDDIKDIDDYE